MKLLGLSMMSVAMRGSGVVAAAASPGVASWPALIGAEMMVNGDCSSGTGWFFGAGGAIALGKMTLASYSDTIDNDGLVTIIDGATYRTVFTIDTVSLGSINWGNGLAGIARNTVGTFSQDIVASDTSANLSATTATMQLDSFSVKSVGLLGVEADWTIAGGAFVDGAVVFTGGAGDTASLTGAAQTSFDAAVSNSTACTVTVTISQYDHGTIEIRMKGGSWVDMAVDNDGDFVKPITSGAGSGFDIRSTAGADFRLVRIQITLAP